MTDLVFAVVAYVIIAVLLLPRYFWITWSWRATVGGTWQYVGQVALSAISWGYFLAAYGFSGLVNQLKRR
jgi:hypothetical protein